MKNKISKLYLALVFLFLYAPIVVLVVYSFNDSKSRGNWGGFTNGIWNYLKIEI
jgi:spermidine/putrescine transport system permease protein